MSNSTTLNYSYKDDTRLINSNESYSNKTGIFSLAIDLFYPLLFCFIYYILLLILSYWLFDLCWFHHAKYNSHIHQKENSKPWTQQWINRNIVLQPKNITISSFSCYLFSLWSLIILELLKGFIWWVIDMTKTLVYTAS